jgi:hypothetical protein
MVVKRIGVGSLAKILAALYAAAGLIIGAIIALVSLVTAGATLAGSDQAMPRAFGALFGVGAVIFLPLLYGCIGAIAGAIGALVYNLVAGMVGGVELEVE